MYSEQAPQQQLFHLKGTIEISPEEWITGTEPMTPDQRKYLKTLSLQTGEHFDDRLSKASADSRIKDLQKKMNIKI